MDNNKRIDKSQNFYNWYANIIQKDYEDVVDKTLIYLQNEYYNLIINIKGLINKLENQLVNDKMLYYFNKTMEEYKEFDVCQNKGYKYYNNLLCWYSFVNDDIKALN